MIKFCGIFGLKLSELGLLLGGQQHLDVRDESSNVADHI